MAQLRGAAPVSPSPALPLPAHVVDLLEAGVARRSQGYRGRFAPSPSGALHRGNLRTALLGWLEARLRGGEWLLRIDDLDTPRNRPGAEESLLADLEWLGLIWDGPPLRQSHRRGLLCHRALGPAPGRCPLPLPLQPADAGRHLGPPRPPEHLPGHCRERPPAWGPEQGRLPSWRLALPPGPILWQERFSRSGRLEGPAEVGDTVLRRADGVIAYHLATACDELALGISDVLRGEDLWASTGPQVAVMAALGWTPPIYGHVPLWRDGAGQRLSKRDGSEGLEACRARGLDGPAVIGELAASLALVPSGSRLSALELLQTLRQHDLERCLRPNAAPGPEGGRF